MKKSEFSIAGRRIGAGEPPFVIAELSGNHNGELSRALELVDAAADAGADAVKLQTYTADTITIEHDGPEFVIDGTPWANRTLYDLYKEASTPWDWHEALFDKAKERGMIAFSSPFDPTAVSFLEALGVPAYKIASLELVDTPLIRKVAETGQPLIMSTGIATYGEIEDAVMAAKDGGATDIALLHCVSSYPAEPSEMRLATIGALARAFGTTVGLSDHSLGTAVAVAAIACGAQIVEKHLTLARADGGPDADFSLEPHEFRQLVEDCRMAHAAIGPPLSDRRAIGKASAPYRRSLYAVEDVKQGEILTDVQVRSIRPGKGLAPKYLNDILGRRASRDIRRGTPLDWSMID